MKKRTGGQIVLEQMFIGYAIFRNTEMHLTTHTLTLSHTFNQSAVGKHFNYLSVIELNPPGTYIVCWSSGANSVICIIEYAAWPPKSNITLLLSEYVIFKQN